MKNQKQKEKYHNNTEYKLMVNIRNRINDAIINEYKNTKSIKYLGIPIKEYKEYLENQFTSKMNWENNGSYWNIDNIITINTFELVKEE